MDRQQSFAWTGDAYNILVLPEPNTTSRSQFNVVSTMFNRMATQKLEKLAEGNKDLTKTATLLKSSNKQVVSQFGLSRGLSKSFSSKITLKDALDRVLYTEARASSVENSIPDLNDIAIDFSKKDDPVTLKFTVIIGGIQSLADPNDPSSYDKVVNIISNVVASGNKSSDIVFPGGAKLSAGGSFGALVSEKVQTFVQTQGASLGFSQAEINNIKLEAVALASAIDNPPIGNATVDKALYSSNTNSYKIGNTISISPQVTGASDFQITEVCSAGVCQAVTTISSSQWLQFSSITGVFSGTVPADLPGDIAFQVKVKATKSGTSTTALVNFSFRGKPSLSYKGNYVATTSTTTIPSQFSVGPLPPNTNFSATTTLVGANSTLSITGLPAENCIQFSTTTGLLSGNFSCLTQDTTAQVTITNDMGSNTFPVKFIPNVKPTVSSLSISGTLLFQNTLTATYVYTDTTLEGVSLYSWYRCAANGTCTEISSAKAKTYTAQIEDVGQSIKFQVTPVDNLGLSGEAVTSTAVQIANRAPSITSVSIANSENAKAGNKVSALASGYSDPDTTPFSSYNYKWFICSNDANCTEKGTTDSYTVSETDSGKILKLQVSPVDTLGAIGSALSATITIKESTPPVVSDPNIFITLQSATSVSLKWNPATDNTTPATQLKYRIFYSTTASEIQQITTTSSSFPNLQTAIVGTPANPIQLTGLTSETVYYFRIMAEDNDGNRTLYNTRSVLLSNNLMAYFPFDGDIANKSSVALTTTAYGSPVSTTGLYGNAYSFNGASSIAISNNSSIKPISQLTLSLWVNANWFTNCRSGIGVDAMISSTESYGYSMGCNGELVRFNVYVDGSYKKVEFNKKSLSGWNKLTGTYDGSNLKIYLNGVIQSTLPLSGSIFYNNNNSIQIGAEASDGTNPDYSLAFTGSIDEVMIYNKALTVDEIKADIPIFSSSQDLVLYMPFNGNFNDESPSPMTQARYNNALTSMPYLTTDRRGNSGSNAYFSDRTNYLVMTNADKVYSLASNYTMSAWINLDAGIVDHGIFSTWNANSGMILRVNEYRVQNQNFTCPTTITPGQ